MSKTPVPITLSAEDCAAELFNNPGEESEPMQRSVCGNAELTLSSGDGCLGRFPPAHVPYPSAV